MGKVKRVAFVPNGVAALVLLVGWILRPAPAAGETGAELFQQHCAACHSVGGGRLVGPDLAGVTERRSMEWLVEFVEHSQSLIKAGDPDAVAVFEDYQRMPMPDQPLTEAQIVAIIEYTKQAGKPAAAGGTATAPAQPVGQSKPSAEAIVLGRHLFDGTARFANGGPPCNSCHEVNNDAVIGGGALARELTNAFSRIGGAGVEAILRTPTFPVMRRAYKGKPLTDREIAALAGFLQHADGESAGKQPRDYGARLAGSGVVGTFILLGIYSLFWRRRRKVSVNQEIYDRQIRSI